MPQSEFEQRVFDHKAFRLLNQCLSLAKKLEKTPKHETTEENVDCFNRIQLALAETQSRIESSTKLINEQTLNNIQGVLSDIYNNLEAFEHDSNHPLCNAGRGPVDQLIRYIQEIPPATPIAKRLAPTLTHLRDTLNLRVAEFQATSGDLSNQLASLREETDQFLRERIAFFDEQQASIQEKADEAAKMLNTISAYTLDAQYAQENETHRNSEKKWTRAGYLLLALLGAVGLFLFLAPMLDLLDQPESFGAGIGRFLQQSPLLGGIATAATLVFRRAAYHRKREEISARLTNELLMLRAFIGPLPEHERISILTLVAPRYFIGGSTQTSSDDSKDLADILERIQKRREPNADSE